MGILIPLKECWRAARQLAPACKPADKDAVILALADRILAAHEVLANRAEKRTVVLTERDYCPL